MTLVPIRPLAAAIALAALATAGPAAGEEEASSGTATIGNLTLAYDPGEWEVEAGPDGRYAVTCIGDSCDGAVVDIRAFASVDYCDERAVVDRQPEAFPWATRHAVNLRVIELLALYFGQSSDGPLLDDGRAVFACLNREGMRYEFVARAEGEPPVGQDAVILKLLEGLSAPAAAQHRIDLGGVSISFAGDMWQPELEDAAAGVWRLTCLPPYCHGRATAILRTEPLPEPNRDCGWLADNRPTFDRLVEGELTNPTDLAAGIATDTLPDAGLPVRIGVITSQCRAMSPPQFVACAIHDGMRYTLWTSLSAGCHRGPTVSEAAFLKLVRTLVPTQ